ncbi:hypothetical protein EFO72_08245, partial [Limosilactobacillus reuteri]|nr:hypothetical protein [Limosilactobacillus reuteri]MCT3197603.1 hypothetical protein [Limosilactobacillus reuteri]
FGSLNMIPDVTPNGVFYLPPTGWLTSFYNPPSVLFWFPSLYSLKKWYNLSKYITCLFGGSNLWIKNIKTS